MPEEKWYQNPEKASQAAAVIILALAALLTWLFAGEEVKKMFALAVSGDVEALAAVGTARGASDMRAPYSSSCSGRCRSAGHSKKLIM